MCALGYAMVFVAAQGYVLDRTGQQNRAQGFALFIGAIMVATVCGPSIGGILADNIGFRASFGVSALMALASILAITVPIWRGVAQTTPVPIRTGTRVMVSSWMSPAFRNPWMVLPPST